MLLLWMGSFAVGPASEADSPIVKEGGSADQWIGDVGLGYLW